MRWQLDKLDISTLPSAHEQEAYLRPQLYEGDLQQVIKSYPSSKFAALAAYDMIDNKLCGDWQGLPKCPEMEAGLYEQYANRYPDSPKAPEALYNATYREGVLVEMYLVQDEKKRSDAGRSERAGAGGRDEAALSGVGLCSAGREHCVSSATADSGVRERQGVRIGGELRGGFTWASCSPDRDSGMPIYQVIVLAIVQGLAELLPVSSSAHVVVAESKSYGAAPVRSQMTLLLVMLHTGTMFAVIVYFWKQWVQSYFASADAFKRFAVRVIWATALTGVIGEG